MLNFALSQQENTKIFEIIKKEYLCDKTPQVNPEINIILAQTGSGKSNISNLILKENKNFVLIDSDKLKKYNPLNDLILKNCPEYFGYLTGLDCYIHKDKLFNECVDNNYNILIEVAPSVKEGLFGLDFKTLIQKNYKINVHILAVSKINSLLHIHERYENQILNNKENPKLTDLKRAIDSFQAVEKIIEKIEKDCYVNLKIYYINEQKKLVEYNCNNCDYVKTLQLLREKDYKNTLKNLDERITYITEKMEKRNAIQKQRNQFKKILKLIEKVK